MILKIILLKTILIEFYTVEFSENGRNGICCAVLVGGIGNGGTQQWYNVYLVYMSSELSPQWRWVGRGNGIGKRRRGGKPR